MNPFDLSARLRSVADRIDRSARPSRSAVAAELKDVLMSVGRVAAGPTKIVVSEAWSHEDAKAVAMKFGATDLREGPTGDIGMEVPLQAVKELLAGEPPDVVHVFDSWLEAAGGGGGDDDPYYEFTPIDISSAPAGAPGA